MSNPTLPAEIRRNLCLALRSCRCPLPVLSDDSVAACVDSGNCGCDNGPALIAAEMLDGDFKSPVTDDSHRELSPAIDSIPFPSFPKSRSENAGAPQ